MTTLRKVLRLNAASCLVFGCTFAAFPAGIAAFIGRAPESVVLVAGLALLVNAVHLILASMRLTPMRLEIIWFSAGDLLWWTGTLGLIAADIWITSRFGIVAALAVATAVAAMGLAQLWDLGRQGSSASHGAFARRIGRSWLALPLWVKTWLFALNAMFLASIFVMPSELGRITLIAYVGSGPLLMAFAFYQGGLSRLMGLGHLIPWVPLLIWLLHGLGQGAWTAAQAFYGSTLALVVAICLTFDIYDLLRWLRGERELLGAS